MADVTIYHNPNCGTSRNTLAMIREAGIEPRVVEYLKNPPDHASLKKLVASLNVPVRDILRQRGTPYEELDLGNPRHSDEELLDYLVEHPILLNRPIVTTPLGARICRPAERVLEILPKAD